jgi:hypothetical protein
VIKVLIAITIQNLDERDIKNAIVAIPKMYQIIHSVKIRLLQIL